MKHKTTTIKTGMKLYRGLVIFAMDDYCHTYHPKHTGNWTIKEGSLFGGLDSVPAKISSIGGRTLADCKKLIDRAMDAA